QALGDVPGEIRVADHVGHRTRPPAFVGRLEPLGAAYREGRDDVHVERAGVVVVDQDHHVGHVLGPGDPLLDRLVAAEHRAPVVVAGLAGLDRRTQRGDVARSDAGGNAGHDQRPSLIERTPSGERPPLSIISAYSSWVIPVIEPAANWKLFLSVEKSLDRK